MATITKNYKVFNPLNNRYIFLNIGEIPIGTIFRYNGKWFQKMYSGYSWNFKDPERQSAYFNFPDSHLALIVLTKNNPPNHILNKSDK